MKSLRKVVIVFEGMIQSNRCLVLGAILGIVIACWAWIVPMALDMQGNMSGSSAWMMTNNWDSVHRLLLCSMWIVMMIGMMLPSAAIAVLGSVPSKTAEIGRNYAHRTGLAFMAGYIAVWSAFSVLARLFRERQLGRDQTWLETRASYPRRWREAASDSEYLIYLTAEELEQLNRELAGLLWPRFQERLTDPAQRPAGSVPVDLLMFSYPIGLPPTESGDQTPASGTE